MEDLISIANCLCQPGKGLAALDESTGTIGKRLQKAGLSSDEVNPSNSDVADELQASCLMHIHCRRPGEHTGSCFSLQTLDTTIQVPQHMIVCPAILAAVVQIDSLLMLQTKSALGAGAILFRETLQQSASDGRSFVQCLTDQGVLPGIKADEVMLLSYQCQKLPALDIQHELPESKSNDAGFGASGWQP